MYYKFKYHISDLERTWSWLIWGAIHIYFRIYAGKYKKEIRV